MARRALLVADGGRDAGLGHVTRSSALALALARVGFETNCYALGAEGPLVRDEVTWRPLGAFAEAPLQAASVLVLDSYTLAPVELDAAPSSMPLVVLHDHVSPPARAALVVSAGSEPDDDPRRLAGLDYACLRPAFWSPPERVVAPRLGRVLVTTGAGDAVAGLGSRLAAAARDALPEADVTLVRGPFATDAAPPGIAVLRAPDSLYEPLLATDVVVTAAGQTLLEAAALGTPTIAVVAVENQRGQAARLAALEAARVLELPAAELPEELARLRDAGVRGTLARNARAAVDGRGAERVAVRIAALV